MVIQSEFVLTDLLTQAKYYDIWNFSLSNTYLTSFDIVIPFILYNVTPFLCNLCFIPKCVYRYMYVSYVRESSIIMTCTLECCFPVFFFFPLYKPTNYVNNLLGILWPLCSHTMNLCWSWHINENSFPSGIKLTGKKIHVLRQIDYMFINQLFFLCDLAWIEWIEDWNN